ncbi:MAG TPA: metalloregulator ArsR/SmtB family transcription factor [Tepiditoga sp.]|nr:winged helix-turn-helix transcriptional regulator [Thermotogota bacterium]HOO73701.1 metalloregulator ArsR/SmtB family transcription factor [Tepiditoga sp.]
MEEFLRYEHMKDEIPKISDFYKIMGDETRLEIMFLLMEAEMSVGEITKNINRDQTTISHQLRLMKKSGFVLSTRHGKYIFYSLDDHVKNIIKDTLRHLNEVGNEEK